MTRANPMPAPTPTATAHATPTEMILAPNGNLPAVAEPQGAARQSPTVVLPPPAGIAKIAEAISAVMGEIGVVGKEGQNKFQNYKYAKMEDILQRLTPLIARHGLAIIQTELDRSMFDNDSVIAIRYAFTIVHKSGEVWPERPVQTGASRCRDSKGGFDDKSLNKAHTAARKYFLLALFQIPTGDEDDADAGHDQRQPQRAPSPGGMAEKAMAARDQQAIASKPHAIPTNGLTVQQWAPRWTSAILKAETAAELTDWKNLNQQSIEKVKEIAPLMYEDTVKAYQRRKAELANAQAGTAAARPAGIPDAENQPDQFLAWADAEMAKVVDPHSLEVMFNDYIEPQAGGLLPPDKSELVSMFTKHERRIGID